MKKPRTHYDAQFKHDAAELSLSWPHDTAGGSTIVSELKWLPELEVERHPDSGCILFNLALLF